MMKQQYPDKAPYKHWNLAEIDGETDDLKTQLQNWHKEHPTFAITQHQFKRVGDIAVLELTYFDIAEAEKSVEEDMRTPRNEFYFIEIVDSLISQYSKVDEWYNENDVDIISKSIDIDTENREIHTGIIYVDRKEAAQAFEKKQDNEMKRQQKMANQLAGLKEESSK